MSKLMGVIIGVWLLSCGAVGRTETLYVAPDGNDAWSGRVARPLADRSDRPLASLQGAHDAIRRLKDQNPAERTGRGGGCGRHLE